MKILVVDDHVILRKGLIRILKTDYKAYEFVEASNGVGAISVLLENDDIALVLSDLSMHVMNGIEMLKQMKILNIKVPVIMLTMHSEDHYAIRALKAGVYGFLNKDIKPAELKAAIDKVLTGKKHITDRLADLLSDRISNDLNDDLIALLSDREMEVVRLIATGKTVSEIATEIGLGVSTVSTYRTRILKKLNLKNNAEIVIYALEHDLK
ncbi:response regulator transcription factor [uncultured Lacinutrix sp.]|uniref:response regulator n=1 Tax=uncultured Lacinutrix sp. TaxID=574032 RepID=UPI00262CFD50|nr:response regulator transcription factor [uncultured Lacinutrix sp.]